MVRVHVPKDNDIAKQHWIDACFNKMNSVWKAYTFTPEQCAELIKLNPVIAKRICDLERLSPEELTFSQLREYYDLHIQLWLKYSRSNNKLTDRLQKIKQAQ